MNHINAKTLVIEMFKMKMNYLEKLRLIFFLEE